ncbi:hypothetical protein DSN97_03700 [Deferribacteraceae bacterium V6Fe1]|nr:hypothetical protein DSN97_03700 [Deferribacteraceae bacterium V6Fe1]
MNKQIKDIIESLNLNIVNEFDENEIIECKNFYFDNLGYHFVKYQENSILLLKGIYKDFVRVIKGEKFLKDSEFTKLSELLSDIEKNIGQTFSAKVVKGTKDLVDITLADNFEKLSVKDKLFVSKPLSGVEYSICRNDNADYDNLYFSSIFKDIFPFTVTPLTASILNSIPEVLSVIFAHASFRVYSPSVKLLWGKVYGSLSTYHMAFESLNAGDSLLKLNYSQFRYLKDKKKKLKNPKISMLGISEDEIKEFIQEANEKADCIDEKYIFEPEFLEHISLLFLAAQMIFLNFISQFMKIHDEVENVDNTLRLIYKTRAKSPFFSSNEIDVPESFDFSSDLLKMCVFCGEKPLSPNEEIKKYSKLNVFKRKRLDGFVAEIHKTLDLRDELSFASVRVFSKIKSVLDKLSEKLLSESKIKHKDTIYYLEYNDLKNILDDNYYGNIQFTYFFKKWQTERYKMQIVPYEIFEKDIPDVEKIAKGIIGKLLNQKEFDVLSFFHKDDFNGDLNDVRIYKNLAFLKDNCKKPVITDNISLLSYAIEYAAINEVPVYAGIRFPEIVLKERKFFVSENKLKISGGEGLGK